MKRAISVLLCVLICICCFAAAPAQAAPSKKTTGYGQKTKLTNPSDFSWDNASVYFLLTDRFYNGNTSNDHSYGRATDKSGSPLSGWNNNPGTFHGGDFAGITKKINEGYFDNLGVNAIWLSAPYEQIHGYVTPGEPNDFSHYSYHGYYVLDYTEPDLNFGTRQEFQTMVDTAHKHGIRVIMDIVMNHAGYNTIKDMITYNFGSFKDKSAAQSYIYKLTGVNSLHSTIDYDGGASEWGRWWGNDWIRSGLAGYTGGDGGDELTSCLAGLPDFRTEQSKSVSLPPILKTKWGQENTLSKKTSKYGGSDTVSNYIVKWLSEWVSEYGVDGFRCDTAKHVEKSSWKKLKNSCVAALKSWRQKNKGKAGSEWQDDFWMTGECWDFKNLALDSYNTEGGFDSMINFGFSGSGVPGISSINGTYQGYAGALNKDPGHNVLTYISSHDSALAARDSSDSLIYQGSAFQLLPGAIQIFYGDETNRPTVPGMSFDGHGGSGHSLRADMNWNSIDQKVLSHWQKVGQFRKKHICIGAGDHQQITSYSASTGYVFSRSYDNGEMADGIVAVIGAPKNTDIEVNVSSVWGNKTKVTNFYDGKTAVVTGGKAVFNSGENGTILIEGPQSSIHMSVKGDYGFYDSQELTVSLRGADYAMISVNGGPAFKVVNGQKFKVGDGIEVGTVFEVVMSAKNDKDELEKSFNFKKKDPNAVTRIYFDNTSYNWSSVYAYIYDESGSEPKSNAAWPGKAMTFDSTLNLYCMDVDDELTNGCVIFSENGGGNRYPGEMAKGLDIAETNMIFLSDNKWEPYTGQTPPPPTQPDPSKTTTIYFNNSNSHFSTPYIYYWKEGTTESDITWPGKAMKKYKDDIWTISFPKDYNMCIFTDNGGNKTGDLKIPGGSNMFDGSSWSYLDVPTNPVPSGLIIGDVNLDTRVNVKDATLIQMHVAKLSTLTGNAFTLADCDGNNMISVKDATNIQFYAAGYFAKCGSAGKNYSGGSSAPATPSTNPVAEPTEAQKQYVYFKNTNWNGVRAYFWSESNKEMMSWPGKDTEKISEGIYRAEVPNGATCVIFNTNGDQTKDLTFPHTGMAYDGTDWSDYKE